MKLFGIEGKGLLISVGITIIMCGAVTYYCHMRVKNVEVALMKQNQVLSSFITNVQGEIRKGGLSDTRVDVSSPEARNAVKNIENSKIEVSDDDESSSEDEDSDSASASEDETDTEDEEGSDNQNMRDMKFVDIHDNFVDTHIRINSFVNDFTTNSKIIEVTDLEEITDFVNLRDETDDESDDESISDSESLKSEAKCDISIKKSESEFKKIILTEANVAQPLVVQPLVEVVIKADVEEDVDDESNDFIKKIVKTEDKDKTSNINKMKIDDLREKVILSGLGTVESVKKLKKSDLITLLTENKQ